jgi:folate-binding protein YgfZ
MLEPYRLDRSLIGVSGPDARSYLQGVLTQDLEKLEFARSLYAALLSPQGKVLADMIVWPAEAGGVLIEADPIRAAALLQRLSMYKLRAQTTIEDVSALYGVAWSEAPLEGAAPDPRFPEGALGWRKLVSRREADALKDGAEAFEQARLALGVPDLARDGASEETFALEGLLEELNGVDFQKGCFVGQENVSRMKRRATTRKKFCPIAFEGPTPTHGGSVHAGEAAIGSVRTGGPGRAMAFLRLDRALEAIDKGQALSAEGRQVRLDPPPWLLLPQRDGEAD